MGDMENEDQLLPDVDLVASAPTLGVISQAALPVEQVDEAGYQLTGVSR